MAISPNVIFDVRTTGSDTANGGAFDPSVTAGMNTDGAATSATGDSPVFTSAAYNFVAGDVGAWLYIASGTNWTPGWYEIASVAANAATLKAAIGEARPVQNPGTSAFISFDVNTVAGCATVASPTSATWTIDYSQQDTAARSYTDLASAGTGLTVSSAAFPFDRQMVGNMIVIDSGTNFNAGNYIIASVNISTNVATVTGATNITTGAGASGVGGMGGAMATPGKAMSKYVVRNRIFLKSGTYTLTTSTPNIAGGPVSYGISGGGNSDAAVAMFIGWDTVRTVLNTPASLPIMHAGAITTITVVDCPSNNAPYILFANLSIDCNNNAATTGIRLCPNQKGWNIHVRNFTAIGIRNTSGPVQISFCSASTGAGTEGIAAAAGTAVLYCESYNNACSGFSSTGQVVYVGCISSGNTGYGFTINGSVGNVCIDSVAYENTLGGWLLTGSNINTSHYNCIAEANGANGWVASTTARQLVQLVNCAGYNNTGGDYPTSVYNVIGFIAQSAGSFFTNAAAGDFTLNATAGQGALLTDSGYPQLLPRGTTTSFPSIGASQVAGATGPSGGVNPFNGLIVSM